jgi:hypothetical protein
MVNQHLRENAQPVVQECTRLEQHSFFLEISFEGSIQETIKPLKFFEGFLFGNVTN